MTTLAVAGALANKHRHGGSVWVRLSWAEALRELGFEVLFVEQIAAADCVDAVGRPADFADSANAATFRAATEAFGFAGDAALVCSDDGRVVGMTQDELLDRLDDAALLVNLSGHLRWRPALELLPRRVFVDLDPGYTQIWHASGGDAAGLEGHELHFTVGANVGTAGCDLPTSGIDWRPIRQPVVLDRWQTPSETCREFTSFTTVASWRGAYGQPVWEGRSYGLKVHEFRRYASLPSSTGLPFAAALDIHPADAHDAERLRAGGWKLLDPALVGDVEGFRRFVRRSGAEFSTAQGVYVETRSGWFSDRTVRYLASGRPALVQDTGFSEHLPVGEGLLAFSTPQEARDGAHAIVADYARHSSAARTIAERCFAPAPALAPLLDAAGLAP
ncbi:MAG: glycosyltransferase [Conexibacter sp.]